MAIKWNIREGRNGQWVVEWQTRQMKAPAFVYYDRWQDALKLVMKWQRDHRITLEAL